MKNRCSRKDAAPRLTLVSEVPLPMPSPFAQARFRRRDHELYGAPPRTTRSYTAEPAFDWGLRFVVYASGALLVLIGIFAGLHTHWAQAHLSLPLRISLVMLLGGITSVGILTVLYISGWIITQEADYRGWFGPANSWRRRFKLC